MYKYNIHFVHSEQKKKDFSENASLSELETSETSANVYPKWNEMIQQYKKHFKVEKQSK